MAMCTKLFSFSGCHYYRCIRLLKESLHALNYADVSETLLQRLRLPRKDSNSRNVKFFLWSTDFQQFSANTLQVKGEQDGMTR